MEDVGDVNPLLREKKIALVVAMIESVANERDRNILTCYYTDFNMTTREIARHLNLPHGTVTVTLSRARAKIKRRLALELTRLEEQFA